MQTNLKEYRVMEKSFKTELEFLEFQMENTSSIEITSFRQNYNSGYYCTIVMNIRLRNRIFEDRIRELKEEKQKRDELAKKNESLNLPF